MKEQRFRVNVSFCRVVRVLQGRRRVHVGRFKQAFEGMLINCPIQGISNTIGLQDFLQDRIIGIAI